MQWRMDATGWVYIRAIDRAGNASTVAWAPGPGREFVYLAVIIAAE
jgi:hypothetical protein